MLDLTGVFGGQRVAAARAVDGQCALAADIIDQAGPCAFPSPFTFFSLLFTSFRFIRCPLQLNLSILSTLSTCLRYHMG